MNWRLIRTGRISLTLSALVPLAFAFHFLSPSVAHASEPISHGEFSSFEEGAEHDQLPKFFDESVAGGSKNSSTGAHPKFRVNLPDDIEIFEGQEELNLSERPLPPDAESVFGDYMVAAQQDCRNRQYELSVDKLNNALDVLQKHLSATDSRIGKCRMRIGAVQFLNRNFDESIRQLLLAANVYEHNDLYNKNCMLVYELLGESYYELLNLLEAEKYAWKAISVSADDNVGDSISRQEALRLHFKAVLAQNDRAKVLRICDEHLKLLPLVTTDPLAGCKNPREFYECFVRNNRFWALLTLGQKREAATELERVASLNDKVTGSPEYSKRLHESLIGYRKSKHYIDGCVAQNGMVWSRERMPIKIFIDDSVLAPELAKSITNMTERALAQWNSATDHALRYTWVSKKSDANMLVAFKKHYRPDGALARTRSFPIIGPCLVPDVLDTKITIDLFLQETPIPFGLSSYGKPLPAYHDQDVFEVSRRRSLSPRAEAELSAVILHEMGHALGIRHSNDPRDLMYFTHFCNMELTARDRETAKIWYAENNSRQIEKAKDSQFKRTLDSALSSNLRKHPDDYFCLSEYGRVALRLRKYGEARRVFLKAAIVSPNNPTAYFNLGLIDMSVDHNAEAIANFKKAQECDSRYAPADILANIATCEFRLKHFNVAGDYSERALRKQPSFHQLHHLYASALYEQKRYELALNEVSRYLEIYPSSSAGYLLEGKILSGLHDYGKSIEAFDHSIELNPKSKIAKQQRNHAASHLHDQQSVLLKSSSDSGAVTGFSDDALLY